jgi:hypothetical protein
VRRQLRADGLLVPVGMAFSEVPRGRSFQRMFAVGKSGRALIWQTSATDPKRTYDERHTERGVTPHLANAAAILALLLLPLRGAFLTAKLKLSTAQLSRK